MIDIQTLFFILGAMSLLMSLTFLYFSFKKKSMYKFYRRIPKEYTETIPVDCVDVYDKDINKREYTGVDLFYNDTYRSVSYGVQVPVFRGKYMGKIYTFCRSKDINQPTFKFVGGTTTILLRPGELNCKDFYEVGEVDFYKNLYKAEVIKTTLAFLLFTIATVLLFYFGAVLGGV